MHLQPQVDLEAAAPAAVDNPLMILLVTAAPVLMLLVHEWHPHLVLLEEVVLEVDLEVDLVAVTLIHSHILVIETVRNQKHSP